jgi:beta-galactosidase GanA
MLTRTEVEAMPRFSRHLSIAGFLAVSFVCAALPADSAEMPRLVKKDGRYALMVDGQPFLILGAQINNSSGWPAVLPEVWPAIEAIHANTVEAPVYWEQLEAQPGRFDFSVVDELVKQARSHHVYLVLLWFGTWKNGKMHYVPAWIKTDPAQYPRVINDRGEPLDVLSPHADSNLEADKKAFAALMQHLKQIDGDQHTVLLVQVENESGSLGSVRDFSPAAEKLFQSQVPDDLVRALHRHPGTWKDVFGADADETFSAYAIARYINQIAVAGKAEYPLPLYVNNWLKYRPDAIPGVNYPSGGPTYNMIDVWKAAAPAIDMIGPDIYIDDSHAYRETLGQYRRADNPVWVPETGMDESFGKLFFYALGEGAVGFSPFGIDYTGWTITDEKPPAMHAENYALISPMDREIARLNFDGKLKTAVEEEGAAQSALDFGKWQATVAFGFPQYDGGPKAPGTKDHHGRALIAQLSADEFLVTGIDARIKFEVASKGNGRVQILRAEEGRYENGNWKFIRLLNGDETDFGLNFTHQGKVVRLKLGTY